jgi:hypothetical protein
MGKVLKSGMTVSSKLIKMIVLSNTTCLVLKALRSPSGYVTTPSTRYIILVYTTTFA